MTGARMDTKDEPIGPPDVLAFWRAAGPDKWFEKDPAFDAAIAERFAGLWRTAAEGGLAPWEETPEGALALVIVLDQVPRNMFRGEARTMRPTQPPGAWPIVRSRAASISKSPGPSVSSSICRSCTRRTTPTRSAAWRWRAATATDRKSTRLNSSH